MKYLYYYLKFNRENIVKSLLYGSSKPSLKIEDLLNITISLHPIEIQQRIVEQLDNIYENEIDNSKKTIEGLEKSIESILRKAKKTKGKIEIEVETQRDAILCAQMGADIIMLDNFTPEQINRTIKKLTELQLRKKVVLEASGRINSKNIVKYAKTNVDMISIGSITNSVDGIDLSLEIS